MPYGEKFVNYISYDKKFVSVYPETFYMYLESEGAKQAR